MPMYKVVIEMRVQEVYEVVFEAADEEEARETWCDYDAKLISSKGIHEEVFVEEVVENKPPI